MVSPRGLTSFRVAFRGAWGLYCLYAICFNSFAAHPLISEDTATQGAGKFELELGNALTDDGADRSYELGPQLSYGVLTTLDVIVRPTWLAQRTSSDSAASWQRGPGDTAIDVKWRFHERERWSFGTRFGINAPTGEATRGLGAGQATYHALLVASVDISPLAVHANVGYARNRANPDERRSVYHVSAASLLTIDSRWRWLLADLAVDTSVQRARHAFGAVARTGAIWSIRPGFDVDVGYQAHLNRNAPVRVILAGVTLRW